MRAIAISIFLVLLSISVYSQEASTLKQLSFEEVKKRKADGSFHYVYATFKNMDGEPISEYDRRELNLGKMSMHYYEDEKGLIKEVRIRPYTLEDKFQKAILYSASIYDPKEWVSKDCDSLKVIFDLKQKEEEKFEEYVKTLDAASMEMRERFQEMSNYKDENFTTDDRIFFILKECEWDSTKMEMIESILDVNNARLAAYHYYKIKNLYEKGHFSPKVWATIQDKILIDHGFDQIYGTVIRSGKLVKIESPYNVNSRRSEMGLGPIEQILDEMGLDFDIEVHRMTRFE